MFHIYRLICYHHQPQGTVDLLNDDDDNFYPATLFFFGRKQNSISDVFLWDYAFTMYNFICIKIKRKAYLVFSVVNNAFCNGRAVKGIT